MLWCASALLRSGRSSVLDTAFRSPAATADLSIRLRSRVNAPGLYLRTGSKIYARPVRLRTPASVVAFLSPSGARSSHVARCQVRNQNSLSVLKPPLPSRTSQSFGIVALDLIPIREAYPCELPDFLSLPAAPQIISYSPAPRIIVPDSLLPARLAVLRNLLEPGRFFQVWLPLGLPRLADHPVYFGSLPVAEQFYEQAEKGNHRRKVESDGYFHHCRLPCPECWPRYS